jgi:hypothetical protein
LEASLDFRRNGANMSREGQNRGRAKSEKFHKKAGNTKSRLTHFGRTKLRLPNFYK